MTAERESVVSHLLAARREFHARQRVEASAKVAYDNAKRKRRAAAAEVEKCLQALEQGQMLLNFQPAAIDAANAKGQ
jgi:hypothetical protein